MRSVTHQWGGITRGHASLLRRSCRETRAGGNCSGLTALPRTPSAPPLKTLTRGTQAMYFLKCKIIHNFFEKIHLDKNFLI